MTTLAYPIHNWRIPHNQEHPFDSVIMQMSWQIAPHRRVMVTNHMNGVRYDKWLVIEETKVVLAYSGLEYKSVISQHDTQTKALDAVRSYVHVVYGQDIVSTDYPF